MTDDYSVSIGSISLFYQEQQYTIHLDYMESSQKYAVYGSVPLYIRDGVPVGYVEFNLSTSSVGVARRYYAYQMNYLKKIERYI